MPPLVDPGGSGWGGGADPFSSHDNVIIPPPPGASYLEGGSNDPFGGFGSNTLFAGATPAFGRTHEQFPGWDDSGGITSGWGSPGGGYGGLSMGGSFGGSSSSGFGGSALFAPHSAYPSNNPYPPDDFSYAATTPGWDWSPNPPRLGRPRKYQTGLTRSNSYSPYSNASSMTPDSGKYRRPLSSIAHPSLKETFAERPSEWRQGFSFRSGLASLVPRRQLSSAGDRSYSPFGSKSALHPYLRYNISNPPVVLDLRQDPATVRFHALGREANTAGDFTRLVCDPPVMRMRLFHDRLPWYIDIQATDNPIGITFFALFQQMWHSLMTPIQAEDFYNHEMSEVDREKVTTAWRLRIGSNEAEKTRGILRVDFLRKHVIFQGLSKAREGHWEMKTKKM